MDRGFVYAEDVGSIVAVKQLWMQIPSLDFTASVTDP